jgi:hypothetical protein
MSKQPAFPGLRDAMKKKQTRRELFLAEMNAVVCWTRLLAEGNGDCPACTWYNWLGTSGRALAYVHGKIVQ